MECGKICGRSIFRSFKVRSEPSCLYAEEIGMDVREYFRYRTWYCVAVVADGTVPFIRYKPYRPVGSAENGGMSQFGFERPSRRGSYRREDRLVGNDERTATFAAVRSSFCGERGSRTYMFKKYHKIANY